PCGAFARSVRGWLATRRRSRPPSTARRSTSAAATPARIWPRFMRCRARTAPYGGVTRSRDASTPRFCSPAWWWCMRSKETAVTAETAPPLSKPTRRGEATVSGNRLVVDEGERHRLHAFDLTSGALLWDRPAFSRSHGRSADAETLDINVWRY